MFGIEEFLVPLVLQDRLVCVDEFLSGSPTHQIQLVKFLDSSLGKSGNLRNALEQTALSVIFISELIRDDNKHFY